MGTLADLSISRLMQVTVVLTGEGSMGMPAVDNRAA